MEKAKLLDKDNPFIVAFEERIAVFEQKKATSQRPTFAHEQRPREEGAPPPPPKTAELAAVSRDVLELQLRHQIEEEYKTRFTHELRLAEEKAARTVEEERHKLDVQQRALAAKYENQVAAAREEIEKEYRQKLQEEIASSEKEMEQRQQARSEELERGLRAALAEESAAKLNEVRDRIQQEHKDLLEKERQTFAEREQSLTREFNQKLLDALRKNETVVREQALQHQKLEEEAFQKRIELELQAALSKEREVLKQQFLDAKALLETSAKAEEARIRAESQQNMQQQLESLRKRDAEELESHRQALRTKLEEEFRADSDKRIAAERERIQQEADAALQEEKQRLQEEFMAMLDIQNENIQRIRVEMRKEMDRALLERLERIAREYDHKMDLLGAQVPQKREDRFELYRERMRSSYTNGEPTVDNARSLMQLKELLELSFDDHLQVEAEVRLDLYVKTVERKILLGELRVNDAEGLERLKQQFRISAAEAGKLEPYILSSFKRFAAKGRILLVDDDTMLLRSLEGILTDCGFLVMTAVDIQRALEYLRTMSFDLIVSDIKFAVGELDGFKFFRSVQEQPHLRNVPFVFMSSLEDGAIVRSGIQLGVDDYLTKPVEPDLLIAVIEGKLKRYRSFAQN